MRERGALAAAQYPLRLADEAGERGPGGHGGIKRACVTAAMRPARDEMLFAFSNEKGAIPPA
jgi:hypothetical protein